MSSPASAPPVTAGLPSPADDERTRDPVATFYHRADALCRAAVEAARQHERLACLVQKGALGSEQRAGQALVALCDQTLGDFGDAYERAAARGRPESPDGCWGAANGLWLASRDFLRRTRTSARAQRGIGENGDHSAERLAEIALDYDLEASALMLLKQAVDAYRKVRPNLF